MWRSRDVASVEARARSALASRARSEIRRARVHSAIEDSHGARIGATLLVLAARAPGFDVLQTVPYIGEMRAAQIIAIAGEPSRFRSLRAFWAYGGLGVVQRLSSEHRVESGKAVREERARGIRLRVGQPLLKQVLRDIALHASLGRGSFHTVFERHVARGKSAAVARVALARKIAAVILAVWRSGEAYVEPVA